MGIPAHSFFRCLIGAFVALVLLCATVEQASGKGDRERSETDPLVTGTYPALSTPSSMSARAILPAGVRIPLSLLERFVPSGSGAWVLGGSMLVSLCASQQKPAWEVRVRPGASEAYPRLHFLHVYRC